MAHRANESVPQILSCRGACYASGNIQEDGYYYTERFVLHYKTLLYGLGMLVGDFIMSSLLAFFFISRQTVLLIKRVAIKQFSIECEKDCSASRSFCL